MKDEHKYTYTIEVEEELFPEVGEFEPTSFAFAKDGKDFTNNREEYEKFIEILRMFVWDYDNNGMDWLEGE